MRNLTDPAVTIMASIRALSGALEVLASLICIRLNNVEYALRINSLLGFMGPLAFLAVNALGIAAIRYRVRPTRILAILLGALLILWGTSSH